MLVKNIVVICIALFTGAVSIRATETEMTVSELAPGVTVLSAGTPDRYTPYSVFGGNPALEAMRKLPAGEPSVDPAMINLKVTDRGCTVSVPLGDGEQLYGFGLQFETFGQRGLRKQPRVNDNPLNGLGYTHAPQPFYVSTAGYGILVNTNRNTTFLCGTNEQNDNYPSRTAVREGIATDTGELYRSRTAGNRVYIDIPGAKGVEVMVIDGPTLKDVVRRYNLLGGGGCLPPMWGLGFKYRVKGDAVQDSVMRFAGYFRDRRIPCDVLGLEPGWQTAAYSCTYVWDEGRFPDHCALLSDLKAKGYHANLWEHAYVNRHSPIHKDIEPYSGNFLVWGGLVPDFLLPEARSIFGGYHASLISDGVAAFKLDECDNSNISRPDATWCFPDMAEFPSGVDGEQMHQMFGGLYMSVLDDEFRKTDRRAYHDYRSSGLFMSSRPAVLYSDSYDHTEYIRALCNSAFGGLLWCPEVRDSRSADDFFHRLQTVMLSPEAMVNSWYLQYPPWLQFDRGRNEKADFLPEAEEYENTARELINMRMALLPYLYSAFNRYRVEGTPVFRPLVMDYPGDENTLSISDQYMIGDVLMAAPLVGDGDSREVYFPEGIWYDINTDTRYEGGNLYRVSTDRSHLPLYVKAGTLLPLAEPVQFVGDDTVFRLNCKVYGVPETSCTLFEDDGVSYAFERGEYNDVTLTARNGKVKLSRAKGPEGFSGKRYEVVSAAFID